MGRSKTKETTSTVVIFLSQGKQDLSPIYRFLFFNENQQSSVNFILSINRILVRNVPK